MWTTEEPKSSGENDSKVKPKKIDRRKKKHINHKKLFFSAIIFSHAFFCVFKKQTESCLEGHTQNVSAHNYILELNNCTTCEKMTEIKQVNVSVCSLSFCFFFSPDRWVSEQGGTGRVFFCCCCCFFGRKRGGWCHYSETKWFASNRCWTLSQTCEVTKLERLKEGGWAGLGWGSLLLYNSVQIHE